MTPDTWDIAIPNSVKKKCIVPCQHVETVAYCRIQVCRVVVAMEDDPPVEPQAIPTKSLSKDQFDQLQNIKHSFSPIFSDRLGNTSLVDIFRQYNRLFFNTSHTCYPLL